MTRKEDTNWQLFEAIDEGDTERAKQLLDSGATVNALDSLNYTALMIACKKKNRAMADLLLKRGAAVNYSNKWELTAMMIVAREGNEELFHLLLQHDADVMKKDWRGWTAIHWAALSNKTAILDQLLLLPCLEHSRENLTVDIANKSGHTPLWLAACSGHVDCVHTLLAHGANPLHQSLNDGSPLEAAKKNSHSSIVSIMAEAMNCALKFICSESGSRSV